MLHSTHMPVKVQKIECIHWNNLFGLETFN